MELGSYDCDKLTVRRWAGQELAYLALSEVVELSPDTHLSQGIL